MQYKVYRVLLSSSCPVQSNTETEFVSSGKFLYCWFAYIMSLIVGERESEARFVNRLRYLISNCTDMTKEISIFMTPSSVIH